MSSWGSKSISTFVRRRRHMRMEHRPAVTSAKVDRVAAALAERDRLIGPYSKPADKLVLRVTSCVFETDAHQQRHFELRFSWYVHIRSCVATVILTLLLQRMFRSSSLSTSIFDTESLNEMR